MRLSSAIEDASSDAAAARYRRPEAETRTRLRTRWVGTRQNEEGESEKNLWAHVASHCPTTPWCLTYQVSAAPAER